MTLFSHVRKEVRPIRKPQQCPSFTPSFLPFSLPNSHFCLGRSVAWQQKISKNILEQILPGTSPHKGEQQDNTVESYEWGLPFMYTVFRLLLQIHKWIRDIHRRNCALSRRFGKEHYLSQLHFGRGYSLSLLEVCKSRGYIVDDVTLIRTISVSVKI